MFKAIIVDDEIDIRRGLRKIIDWESKGFMVVGEAGDGKEAIELFKEQRPSLVVTDIRIPEIDGLELIKKLKEINPKVKIIILSGYNDFNYAKEALKYSVNNYLLKPVDIQELGNELSSIREVLNKEHNNEIHEAEREHSLKNETLLSLVKNQVKEEDLQIFLKKYGIDLEFKTLCVALVQIDNYREYKLSLTSSEIALKKIGIKNIIEELLNKEDLGYVFDESEDMIGLLLTITKERNGCNKLQRVLENVIECLVKYVSEEVTEFSELSKVIWNNSKLLDCLGEGNEKAITKEVDRLFKEIEEKEIPIPCVKYILTDTIIEMGKLILNYNGQWENLYFSHFRDIDDILRQGDRGKVRKYILDICYTLQNFINTEKEKKSPSVLEKVLDYIDIHYNQEISLKKLADIFYINQFYLGQLIKKKKGINFNDYINNLKVEEAKRLLLKGKMSIKDISEKIGYKYLDHFYKNFKLITGISPGKFKRE